jgi:hypothetical protein
MGSRAGPRFCPVRTIRTRGHGMGRPVGDALQTIALVESLHESSLWDALISSTHQLNFTSTSCTRAGRMLPVYPFRSNRYINTHSCRSTDTVHCLSTTNTCPKQATARCICWQLVGEVLTRHALCTIVEVRKWCSMPFSPR